MLKQTNIIILIITNPTHKKANINIVLKNIYIHPATIYSIDILSQKYSSPSCCGIVKYTLVANSKYVSDNGLLTYICSIMKQARSYHRSACKTYHNSLITAIFCVCHFGLKGDGCSVSLFHVLAHVDQRDMPEDKVCFSLICASLLKSSIETSRVKPRKPDLSAQRASRPKVWCFRHFSFMAKTYIPNSQLQTCT